MRCKKIALALGIGFFAALFGLYWGREALLQAIGRSLQVSGACLEPPWDVIVVLSGRPYERSLRAAELYQLSPTPILALGGGNNDDLLAMGYHPARECAFTQLALRSLCVPDSLIETLCAGTSTVEELQVLQRQALKRGWKRILIVSSPFHGRRVQRLAQRWLEPAGIQWGFAAARPLAYRPEAWWHSEAGLLTVWEELAKSWYYQLRGHM